MRKQQIILLAVAFLWQGLSADPLVRPTTTIVRQPERAISDPTRVERLKDHGDFSIGGSVGSRIKKTAEELRLRIEGETTREVGSLEFESQSASVLPAFEPQGKPQVADPAPREPVASRAVDIVAPVLRVADTPSVVPIHTMAPGKKVASPLDSYLARPENESRNLEFEAQQEAALWQKQQQREAARREQRVNRPVDVPSMVPAAGGSSFSSAVEETRRRLAATDEKVRQQQTQALQEKKSREREAQAREAEAREAAKVAAEKAALAVREAARKAELKAKFQRGLGTFGRKIRDIRLEAEAEVRAESAAAEKAALVAAEKAALDKAAKKAKKEAALAASVATFASPGFAATSVRKPAQSASYVNPFSRPVAVAVPPVAIPVTAVPIVAAPVRQPRAKTPAEQAREAIAARENAAVEAFKQQREAARLASGEPAATQRTQTGFGTSSASRGGVRIGVNAPKVS